MEKVKRIRVDEKAYGTEATTEVEYLVFEFQHQRYLYDAAEDNFFVQQYALNQLLTNIVWTRMTS